MLRLLTCIGLALVAGCTGAPAMQADPTSAKATAPPSVAASGAPTSVPSGSPASATDVVLRMQRTGGHLYPGTTLDVPATFTLYADGAVIYTAEVASSRKDLRHGLHRAHMDAEQMTALTSFALGPGGLADAAERYSDVPIADAVTVIFTVEAAGFDKTVSVYALGDEMGSTPETQHRLKFRLLADLLIRFEDEVARGNATDVGSFEPEAYRVRLFPDEFGEFPATGAWPWRDLAPSDFEPDQSGFLIRVVTPDQARAAVDLPASPEIGDPMVVGPDNVKYLVRVRPLLPDEVVSN